MVQENVKNIMVSVCMVTYNHEPFIAQAIEGVLMQITDFRVELVIGEDCSTDNTRQICEEYATKYPERIRLITGEKNLGLWPNYIRTFQACTARYIAYCEGDDYWTDPLKLQLQVNFLEQQSNCSFVIHYAYRKFENSFTSGKDVIPKDVKLDVLSEKEFFNLDSIATSSILFRSHSEVFEPLKKLVQIKKMAHSRHVDFVLLCSFFNFGYCGFIPKNMSVYRKLEGALSWNKHSEEYLRNRIYELFIERAFFKKRAIRAEINKKLYSALVMYLATYGNSKDNPDFSLKRILFFRLKFYTNRLHFKFSFNHKIDKLVKLLKTPFRKNP